MFVAVSVPSLEKWSFYYYYFIIIIIIIIYFLFGTGISNC